MPVRMPLTASALSLSEYAAGVSLPSRVMSDAIRLATSTRPERKRVSVSLKQNAWGAEAGRTIEGPEMLLVACRTWDGGVSVKDVTRT